MKNERNVISIAFIFDDVILRNKTSKSLTLPPLVQTALSLELIKYYFLELIFFRNISQKKGMKFQRTFI